MNRRHKSRLKILIQILLIIILLNPLGLSAQEKEITIDNQYNSQISQFFNSLKYTSTHAFDPAGFEPWKTVVVAGFAIACFTSIDFEFKEEYVFEKHYPPLDMPKYLSKVGKIYDSPDPFYFTLVAIGGTYGSGLFFEDIKLQQTAKLMLHSLLITGIYSTFLKALIGRARPYMGRSPYNLKPFNFNFNPAYTSMPSGHTSSIFAMMSVLAGQYDSYFIKVPAYAFATTVAFQRVDNNKHWTSDVFFGAILGYLVGSSLVEKERNESSYSIQPVINEQGIGLNLSF